MCKLRHLFRQTIKLPGLRLIINLLFKNLAAVIMKRNNPPHPSKADPVSGNYKAIVGTFTKYLIVDNDLYLTENMYWSFEPKRLDAIRVWKLSGVKNFDLDKKKLDTLISDNEVTDIEEIKADDIKRLIIDTYEYGEFAFNCNEVHEELRPFNSEELTEMILRQENTSRDQQATIYKQQKLINELHKYIDKEIDKKTRILEELSSNANKTLIKSKHQLEILILFKNIINNNSFK